jgi:hypothetical protein
MAVRGPAKRVVHGGFWRPVAPAVAQDGITFAGACRPLHPREGQRP